MHISIKIYKLLIVLKGKIYKNIWTIWYVSFKKKTKNKKYCGGVEDLKKKKKTWPNWPIQESILNPRIHIFFSKSI